MPITLTTAINKICFLCELERLAFRIQGEDSMTLRIAKGDETIFENTYYPDSDGNIVVYDIDRIIEPFISMANIIGNAFYFYANDNSIVSNTNISDTKCIVIPSFASVSESALDFVPDFFLSAVTGIRITAVGRKEVLTPFVTESTAVTVEAEYLSGNVLISGRVFILPSVSGCSMIDVSPAKFADESVGTLIGYVVKCGHRTAIYRVMHSSPDVDPAMIFRNSFGCWETFYFTGTKTQSPEYERSTAMIDGKFTTYDIEETMLWTVKTGVMSYGMSALAKELARSREVYLMDKEGNPGDRVEITECDVKAGNDDALYDLEFTYRRADRRSAQIEAVRPPKLFDNTFDNTFN